MIRGLFLLRNVVILTLILSCVFSFNVLYGAENINDYIMEEITDNTAHPFYTIPIKFVKYIDFDFKRQPHALFLLYSANLFARQYVPLNAVFSGVTKILH